MVLRVVHAYGKLALVMCEPQVFGLRAGLSLPFFVISGFGRVRVVQNLLQTGGQASIYLHTGP